MLDVDARVEPVGAERREHRDRAVGGVVVPMEALEGGEIDRERAVEHHRVRFEAQRGERCARRRDPAAGGDEHGDAAPIELRPRRQRRSVRALDAVVRPQRAVEVGDDELDTGHLGG